VTVLDERIRSVLTRLEEEDRTERDAGLPAERRSRQVEPTTGRFLFALAAAHPGINVLELGGSRGYSAIWLGAGARLEAGRVVSIEHDAEKCAAWRRNIGEASLEEWVELVEDDAFEVLRETQDTFDLVFIDAEKEDYEGLFGLSRPLLEAGGLVVADNVLSHADPLAAYSAARQGDPTLSSVTVPLDRGLELTTILVEAVAG
jgi:predicted O-methyltransferase YrrM